MMAEGFHVEKVKVGEPTRGWRIWVLGVVVVTALIVLPIVHIAIRARQAETAAQDAYWKVDGPACQPLAPERFAGVSTPPTVTTYDGTTYQRHGGAITCTHRVEKIGGLEVRSPVCKFSSPDYLSVTSNGQQTYYDLTMGRAASVGVVNGQVRCAVTGKFEM